MNHLPLELVTEIFRMSQEDLEDMEDWYRLRLVEPSWKLVIDRSPKLWRRVDTAAGQKFVDKQMERADGMSLWVQADISEENAYGRAWVERHSDIIERLTLFVASDQHGDDLGAVLAMVGAIHLPNLRHFGIRREGSSGGRLISLPELPVTFAHPHTLAYLEFTGISYAIPTLASNSNIRVLRLNYENSSFKISLAELQTLLPLLPLLADLTLGGGLDIAADDVKRPSTTLPSLARFAFFGKVEVLNDLFDAFLLPTVDHWRFKLEVGKTGIPATCRLREIVRGRASVPVKVVLRWSAKEESSVKLIDGTRPPRFSLMFSVRHGAPFQTLSSFLTGVGALPSVRDLELHGGGNSIDVYEPNDEVIDGVLVALESVERVVVSGNGNSWVRLPVVLKRRLGQGDDLWRNLETLKFCKGVMHPYAVRDWTTYLRKARQSGRLLPVLKLREWKIQTASDWEHEMLTESLEDVAKMVAGKPGKLDKVKYVK